MTYFSTESRQKGVQGLNCTKDQLVGLGNVRHTMTTTSSLHKAKITKLLPQISLNIDFNVI